MKNQETGEFELVLGNKQLLSGFFIVVVLFGVFFVMGYIVGRNSSPASRVAAAESGASSPREVGTIQSSASSPAAGRGVRASFQQASQSALMKRSSRATGRGWPSLEQEDCASAPVPTNKATHSTIREYLFMRSVPLSLRA